MSNLHKDPYQNASRMSRLGATIIDFLIVMLAVSGLIIIFQLLSINHFIWNASKLHNTLALIAISSIVFLTLNYNLLVKHGQTLGKRALNIKIISYSNNMASAEQLFYRYFIHFVIVWIPYKVGWIGLINYAWILRKEKRCIHDIIAKTRVINAQDFEE